MLWGALVAAMVGGGPAFAQDAPESGAAEGAPGPGAEALEPFRRRRIIGAGVLLPRLDRHLEVSLGATGTRSPLTQQVGGSFGLAYFHDDIFAVRVDGAYFADMGQADWRPWTAALIQEARTSPDFSKLRGTGQVSIELIPVHGRVAGFGRVWRFGVFGDVGMGVAGTVDDGDSLLCESGPCDPVDPVQVHPFAAVGGGTWVWTGDWLTRVYLRGMSVVETRDFVKLERQPHLIAGVSVGRLFDTTPSRVQAGRRNRRARRQEGS